MSRTALPRSYVLRGLFVLITLVIIGRLFVLQLFQPEYKIMAEDIAIYRKVVYPPRGVVYDRKGRVMCHNQVVYDLMVTPNEVPKKGFDTTGFCATLGITEEQFVKSLERTRFMNGPMRMGTFLPQLNAAQTARYGENLYAFPGFQLVERSIRAYPKASAGAILGYIGEVSPAMLEKERFASYQQGDYVGIDGLESKYEEVLRGQRGVHFFEKDNYNRPRDPYKRGTLDTQEVAGRALQLYVDAELQEYGERLMQNKLGSVVAIEPSTGGILAMISSPGYDPNLLRGSERSRNFSKLFADATLPLFNRAMKGSFNPGSTQKPLTALIALDAGVISPSYGYPCGGGYGQCGRFIGCTHAGGGHAANLRLALANSCNAYFCHIYRLVVDAKQYGDAKKGLHHWYQSMYNFGYGHPLGVDLPGEKAGTLFDVAQYDKLYNGVWNSCTNVFVGMGQGEIAATPLQMANGMAIIANRGFYYTPHLVKSIGGDPKARELAPYLVKHQTTNIPDSMYGIVALGMSDVVTRGTGKVAQLDSIEVCAKTGTVENYAIVNGARMKMQNHSMFVAFAPRVNPKIAIAVTVENAGYGATWAGPVAALMIERYLTDTISPKRKPLEERMLKGNVISKYVYIIDSAQRRKQREREALKLAQKRYADSTRRAQDSVATVQWLQRWAGYTPPARGPISQLDLLPRPSAHLPSSTSSRWRQTK